MMEREYASPKAVSEVLSLIGKSKGKACLVAGGTNVIPHVRSGALKPDVLIDLSHVKGLSYIKEEKQRIRIGALTTLSEIVSSEIIRKQASILWDAARQIANPLVRNRATIGGNLADASPAADTAPPLLALDASVVIERKGKKAISIDLSEFFLGPRRTLLKWDGIIREIILPKGGPSYRGAYAKLGLRNSTAISVVSVAVSARMEDGVCKSARIGLGAVAPTPIRASGVEKILENATVDEALIEKCCEKVRTEIRPITDIRGSAEYRKEITSVLLGRLLRQTTLKG